MKGVMFGQKLTQHHPFNEKIGENLDRLVGESKTKLFVHILFKNDTFFF